jgi:hypothetical protein
LQGDGTWAAAGAVVGDVKWGYQTADHAGWFTLDGRLKTALGSTQQSAATTLGIGANLPNQADIYLTGASASIPLGTTGGANTATIAQANLPNVNLSGGAHTHVTNFSSWTTDLSASGAERYLGGTGTGGGLANFPKTSASSGALTIPLGGSGTPLPTRPQSLGMNMFIYLG